MESSLLRMYVSNDDDDATRLDYLVALTSLVGKQKNNKDMEMLVTHTTSAPSSEARGEDNVRTPHARQKTTTEEEGASDDDLQ